MRFCRKDSKNLEERMQPLISETKRFLLYVVLLSIILLLFSCFTLLRNYAVPVTISMPIILDKTSLFNRSSKTNIVSPLTTSSQSKPLANIVHGDKRILEKGNKEGRGNGMDKDFLNVYMYDLPPDFHFGLLGWRDEGSRIWPDVSNADRIPRYPGGLNLQHSVEYWLTLDLLSSDAPGVERRRAAIRVKNSSCADVIFVPFFASLSYNRHSKIRGKENVSRNWVLQHQLVKFLMRQEEWKMSGGRDHLIVAHHPNSLSEARRQLSAAMFLLADFGRYPAEISNIKKDIVAPYRHVVKSAGNQSAPFERRPILVYFKGAIYRKDGGVIRQQLYRLLKNKKDVHFAYGNAGGHGISHAGRGMASSKFCLNIAGDTPSSNRLFDAIASHCVPVVISDDIELPFEDVLDYSEFCLFVHASDAVKKGFLLNLLRGVGRDEWTKMWERLKQVAHHFEYQFPTKQEDAVQMIWEAVARKISTVPLKISKEKRFHRTNPSKQRRTD